MEYAVKSWTVLELVGIGLRINVESSLCQEGGSVFGQTNL
jgi:hypothetical protein